MGLILVPLFLFWFFAACYSLWIGYLTLAAQGSLAYGVLTILLAIISLSLYVLVSLRPFKEKTEIWAFEIIMRFLANKYSILCYVLMVFLHLFVAQTLSSFYIDTIVFVVCFTLSAGAIIGAFYSEKFIKKNNIKRTY